MLKVEAHVYLSFQSELLGIGLLFLVLNMSLAAAAPGESDEFVEPFGRPSKVGKTNRPDTAADWTKQTRGFPIFQLWKLRYPVLTDDVCRCCIIPQSRDLLWFGMIHLSKHPTLL